MKEITGTCKFCGQNVLIAVPDCADEKVIQHEAAMTCKCPEAKAYRENWEKEQAYESAKTSAQGTTFELFHEDYPDIEYLFNNAMDMLHEKKFKKITINTHGKTKATLTLSKDTFIVEREDKNVCRRETDLK